MNGAMWTDDPIADFNRWDAEQNRKLERMPVCCECGEHIQDDTCFEINDEIICNSCMMQYRRFTSDLIE